MGLWLLWGDWASKGKPAMCRTCCGWSALLAFETATGKLYHPVSVQKTPMHMIICVSSQRTGIRYIVHKTPPYLCRIFYVEYSSPAYSFPQARNKSYHFLDYILSKYKMIFCYFCRLKAGR